MIISIVFAALNVYFAVRAFRAKQWFWLGISLGLFALCAYDVGRAIL